jgi:hypothetical protein
VRGAFIVPGGIVSRYDQPGFAGAFPTGDPIDAGSLSNAQGSAGGLPHAPGDGASLGSAGLSPVFETVQTGRPSVDVGSTMTQASGTVMADGISGITQASSTTELDGSSHVAGPRHPNSMNGGAP